MGLAEPKLRGKKIAHSWQAQKHREKMLNTSITNAPSLAIGMKLMEQMGWKDGQGLGASEQGIVEPIKLKQTINNKGLGYSRVTGLEQMHYSAHFERFESVLASLGGKEETALEPNNKKMKNKLKKEIKLISSRSKSASNESSNTNSCSSNKKSSSDEETGPLKKNIKQSLESLSRNVRGRVHYQKFTRGKDVSRYSENDLACILGAKAHTLYTANVKQKGGGGKFVFGSLDSKEYFSQQSSALCTPSESRSPSDTDEPKTFTPSYPLNALSDDEEKEEASRPSFGGLGFGAASNGLDDVTENERPTFDRVGRVGDDAVQKCFNDRFAAKYTSAFVRADDGLAGTFTTQDEEKVKNGEYSSNDGGNADLESADTDVGELVRTGKKKRNKNKNKVGDASQPELIEDSFPKKKKKKSRKATDGSNECSALPSVQQFCEVEKKVLMKEKRKKKCEVEDLTECLINTECVKWESKIEKKKERKRKREDARKLSDACNEIQYETTEQDMMPINDDLPAPKKKKSKRKNESICDEIVHDLPDTLKESCAVKACDTDDTSCERKKEKKKKKSSW